MRKGGLSLGSKDHTPLLNMSLEGSLPSLSQTLSNSIQTINSLPILNTAESLTRLDKLKDRLTILIDDNLQDAKARLSARVDELMTSLDKEIDESCLKMKAALEMRDRSVTALGYANKVHIRQAAPISRLLYSMEIRTVYNIFVALMINLAIAALILDYINEKNFHQGWSVFFDSFGKWEKVVEGLMVMWVLSLFPLVFVALKKSGVWGGLLVVGHLTYLGVFFSFGYRYTITNDLPVASSIVILTEAARMTMKMHSYFREKLMFGFPNKYAGCYEESKQTKPDITVGDLSTELKRYVYFSFAPTLIYRDSYATVPRHIRWAHVTVHVFNFCSAILFTAIMFKCHCVPHFNSISLDSLSASTVTVAWLSSVLPGTMVFLNIFFGVNHSWFSIYSELLSFADRRFYSDWWNAEGPEDFYKGICVPLYEWVSTYVYVDLQRFSKGYIAPSVASVLTGLLSGMCLELLIDTSLRIFFPLVFLAMTLPLSLLSIFPVRSSAKLWKVFLWILLLMTIGFLIVLYFLEYEARRQGLPHLSEKYGFAGYFLPQWLPRLKLA